MKLMPTTKLAPLKITTGVFIIIFIVGSIIGVLSDNSVSSSAPKLTSSQLQALSTQSNTPVVPQQLQVQTYAKAAALTGLLSIFYANNNYLPATLDSSLLISQSGSGVVSETVNGKSVNPNQQYLSDFSLPSGAKYVYTATPAGCTTIAKNCLNYTLKAIDISNGAVIFDQTSHN